MTMRLTIAGLATGLMLVGGGAFADSISPDSYSTSLGMGESVTIKKTVTVSAGRPTTSLVDVFFLSDTTGSMGGQINAVRTNASSIMTSLSSFGEVQFGVGEYKDVPTSPWGSGGDFAFKLNQPVTSSTALVQMGINQWSASGGNDLPESNMIALHTVATADSIGFRDGAAKFVVWFGDVYGHTPQNTPGYPGPSLNATVDALVDAGITVIAIGSGLDGQSQATTITAATGGSFHASASSATIVDLIDDAISAAFASYNTVGLTVNGVPGVSVTTSPAYVGSWTREEERTFEFDVTFTGVGPGVHDFTIDARVDGGVVATEIDRITVGGHTVTPVPVPAALPLLLGALAVGGVVSRRRRH